MTEPEDESEGTSLVKGHEDAEMEEETEESPGSADDSHLPADAISKGTPKDAVEDATVPKEPSLKGSTGEVSVPKLEVEPSNDGQPENERTDAPENRTGGAAEESKLEEIADGRLESETVAAAEQHNSSDIKEEATPIEEKQAIPKEPAEGSSEPGETEVHMNASRESGESEAHQAEDPVSGIFPIEQVHEVLEGERDALDTSKDKAPVGQVTTVQSNTKVEGDGKDVIEGQSELAQGSGKSQLEGQRGTPEEYAEPQMEAKSAHIEVQTGGTITEANGEGEADVKSKGTIEADKKGEAAEVELEENTEGTGEDKLPSTDAAISEGKLEGSGQADEHVRELADADITERQLEEVDAEKLISEPPPDRHDTVPVDITDDGAEQITEEVESEAVVKETTTASEENVRGDSVETTTTKESEAFPIEERGGETDGEEDTIGEDSQVDGKSDLTRLVERASLEQQHRSLLLQKRQILSRNRRVQQRLSEHFSRKTDDAERVEKNVGELEQRYTRYLFGIREQQRVIAEEKERRLLGLSDFRAQVGEQMEMVAKEYAKVIELRRVVALKSRSSRTGRLMRVEDVEALIWREKSKEVEVNEARLESLRRETRLSMLEKTLRESEELAGGIHLIDFEQLKIENQTFAEKIEERNEDITKLRRKISSTVQILTHLKERIQFEQTENGNRERRLKSVSTEVTRGRESLALLKQRRDHVRSRAVNQRNVVGLLGHESLLRDFELRVDEEAVLAKELKVLKREYTENQRMSNAIRLIERNRRQQAGMHTASAMART